MGRFCTNCGKEIGEVNFCTNCGKRNVKIMTDKKREVTTDNKNMDGKVFNYLCVFAGVATILVSLIQLITGIEEILGWALIIGLIAFGVLYVAYHIFCRRQYNKLNEEYILSGRISKFGASAYLNLHLSILLCVPMLIGACFFEGVPIGGKVYFIAILAALIAIKILVDLALTKKYGNEEFSKIQTVMMRVSQGKPFFMKGMMAALFGALAVIFVRNRRNRF